MKKIAKLSLVAAVAVAGLTSASASSLEEAISGVDVSGMVRYRYTDTKTEKMPSSQENDYDIEVTAKVPVNDMVKAIVKVDVDGDLRADKNTVEPADAKPSVNVEDAYFSFTQNGFVVNAGKQNVPGPLADSPNGTGIVGLAPIGPVTVAAGWFNGTSAASFNDVYEVGLLGSFQNINVAAWYADARELAEAFSLSADGTFGPVSLAAGYAQKDVDGLDGDANKFSTAKIKAAATFGMFDTHAGYAQSGKAGTGELSDGNDAAVNDFGGKIVDITTDTELKLFNIGAGVALMEKINFGLDYYGGKSDNAAKTKYNEVVATAAYKMSKNFTISSYYAVADAKPDGGSKVETNKGRLELKYTF